MANHAARTSETGKGISAHVGRGKREVLRIRSVTSWIEKMCNTSSKATCAWSSGTNEMVRVAFQTEMDTSRNVICSKTRSITLLTSLLTFRQLNSHVFFVTLQFPKRVSRHLFSFRHETAEIRKVTHGFFHVSWGENRCKNGPKYRA